MTDEERKEKQLRKNAINFANNHFKHKSDKIKAAVYDAYLLIIKDKIIY